MEGEISQARSVVGSLNWIARQVRTEYTYRCSKLQRVVGSALVKHLEAANQLVQEAIATSDVGLFFKAGAFKFEEALLLTVTDARWANEETLVEGDVFPVGRNTEE